MFRLQTPCSALEQSPPLHPTATRAFSPGAVLPGRQGPRLEDPGYGGKPPARLSLLPATQAQVWTMVAQTSPKFPGSSSLLVRWKGGSHGQTHAGLELWGDGRSDPSSDGV